MATTIQISEELKKELTKKKLYTAESYEDVIWDLMEDTMELSDETKRNMANLNVGYISQNAYLYCASEGLAACARASVDRKALAPKLKLRSDQVIILAHSVGHPKP